MWELFCTGGGGGGSDDDGDDIGDDDLSLPTGVNLVWWFCVRMACCTDR